MGCAITKAEVITDNTGVHHTIPVVVTDQGVLRPLVEYLVAIMLSRSISYMKKAAQAVAMLLRYLDANPEMYGDPQRLVRTFVQRLYSGTVGADGSDPSQLFWLSRTNRTSAAYVASSVSRARCASSSETLLGNAAGLFNTTRPS